MRAFCPTCRTAIAAPGTPCPRCIADAPTQPASTAPTLPLPTTSAPALPDHFGKFHILKELGRGGMGVVYEAEDTVMARRVALKTMFTRTADPDAEARFLREAQIAGTLDHPNVVLVYDFGVMEGVPYFTMPLVTGLSLDEVIHHLHGRVTAQPPAFLKIPPEPAARIRLALEWFEGALHGLAHAHTKGIVHRDLKPSNLMLDASSGLLRITDFGLARARHLSGITRHESLMGTVAYMSPEQVGRATMQVDHCADIYSMGVTLYQTLYDRLPYNADTTAGYIEKILSAAPDLRGDRAARLPADLQTILGKSLDKSPAHRYQSAAEFAEDLGRFRRYEPIRARPVGPVGRLARWARRRPGMAALLVLLGLAVAASAALTRAQLRASLLIRAQEIATKVEEAGYEATKGNHARSVELFSEVLGMEPENLDALLGRALSLGQIPDGTQRALADLAVAGRLRPDLSSIHSLRSRYLARSGDAQASAEMETFRSMPPQIALDFRLLGDIEFLEDDCPAAVDYYTQAESLDPRHFWAILRRGMCHFMHDDVTDARIDYEIVAHLAPDHPFPHNNLGNVLMKQGETERARREYLKALELNPNFGLTWHNLGEMSYAQGELIEAERRYRKALQIEPGLTLARLSLGVVLIDTGREEEGVSLFGDVIRAESGRPEGPDRRILSTTYTNLCDVLLARRDMRAAAPHCEEAVRLGPDFPDAHYNLGALRMLSGDRAGALASLERNVDLGDTDVEYLLDDQVFALLHDEPRFKTLVNRMRQALP